jgi:hypothetical protein
MTKPKHLIYTLLRPGRKGKPSNAIYVGRTCRVAARFNRHLKERGHDLKLRILEDDLTDHEVRAREIFWIEKLLQFGFPLENRLVGSNGSLTATEVSREKNRVAQTGKKRSAATRRRMSAARLAAWQDPKYRDKILAICRSDEFRSKISNIVKSHLSNPAIQGRRKAEQMVPAVRKAKSEKAKKLWKDSEYQERRRVGRNAAMALRTREQKLATKLKIQATWVAKQSGLK